MVGGRFIVGSRALFGTKIEFLFPRIRDTFFPEKSVFINFRYSSIPALNVCVFSLSGSRSFLNSGLFRTFSVAIFCVGANHSSHSLESPRALVALSTALLAAFPAASAHLPSASFPSCTRAAVSAHESENLLQIADNQNAPAPNAIAFLNPPKNHVRTNPIKSPCIAPGVLLI